MEWKVPKLTRDAARDICCRRPLVNALFPACNASPAFCAEPLASAALPTSSSISFSNRSCISLAAALVNVITRIDDGSTPQFSTRCFTRWVITVVLPEPGPASTIIGPSLCSIASF